MLRAHSELEVSLDIMMAGCECGGQVEQVGQAVVHRRNVPFLIVRLHCEDCGAEAEREYDISSYYEQGDTSQGPLNPTNDPSELMDIVQYSHMARFYLEYVQDSVTELSIEQARNLLGVGAICVEEAIKHLRGAHSPPPEAVFTPERQVLMQSNLDAFTRDNLDKFQLGIMQHAERLNTIYEILDMMTGDEKEDQLILDRMAAKYKGDPIIFPQIGRIARVLFNLDEEPEEQKH